MARYMRTDLGSGHSRLRPPVVVSTPPVVYTPVQGYLFPISTMQEIVRRRYVDSKLRPPTVVGVATPFVAAPVSVNLAYSRRGIPKSRLSLTQVVFTAVELSGPETTLAYSRRGTPKPVVIRPIVVSQGGALGGVGISLAPSRRGQSKSLLITPRLVAAVTATFRGPTIHLAYSRRGRAQSDLRPPADTIGLEDQGKVRINLAPSRQPARRAHPRLGPPVVIDLSPQVRYLTVNLAYSRRGKPTSRLSPAAVVEAQFVARPTDVTLAPFRRLRAKYALAAPAVVTVTSFIAPPVRVVLARNKVPPTLTRLAAPTVVAPVLARRTLIRLAPQRRGRPVYRLRPPVVIDLSPQTRYLLVNLAYSRRGKPRSLLFEPAVVGLEPQTRYLSVTLTYSRRGVAKPQLFPPTVIDLRPQTVYPAVTLAYSRRPRPISFLREPVLEPPRVFAPVSVTVARIRPAAVTALLRAPAVVAPVLARPTLTWLAQSTRGAAKPTLRPPTVVQQPFVAPPVQVTLTTIRPPRTISLLPPGLVAPPEPVFFEILVHLAYSRRGTPISLKLVPVVVGTFVPPAGDVCGSDEAAAVVCEDVSVDDTTICGDDSTTGSVRGGDTQAT